MSLLLDLILPACLAFLLAAFVSLTQLLSSIPEIGQSSFLLRRSIAAWSYAFIYGGFAVIVFIVPDVFFSNNDFISNVWVRAGVIGVSMNAILHISIVTYGVDNKKSLGLDSIVELFESPLRSRIKTNWWIMVRQYIQLHDNPAISLEKISKAIHSGLDTAPEGIAALEGIEALKEDLSAANHSGDDDLRRAILNRYLKLFGKKALQHMLVEARSLPDEDPESEEVVEQVG